MLIITFHSLEFDTVMRYVQKNRRKLKNQNNYSPSDLEKEENPRSRSAKLVEFILKSKN